MPSFGRRSENNLAGATPNMKRVFRKVVETYDCSILCSTRGEVEQNKAFADGRSKVQYPKSKHNKRPSPAVDSTPWPIDWDTERELLKKYFKAMEDGKITELEKKDIDDAVESIKRWYSFGGYVKGVGISMGIEIRWGGDWDGDFVFKDQTFNDLPHFEEVIK